MLIINRGLQSETDFPCMRKINPSGYFSPYKDSSYQRARKEKTLIIFIRLQKTPCQFPNPPIYFFRTIDARLAQW